MTAVAADPAFADAYDDRGVGGLMGQALRPLGGFGKFLLVLAALSIVGCNLINIYSLAFTVQVGAPYVVRQFRDAHISQNFHPIMLKVPRFIWVSLAPRVKLQVLREVCRS